MKKEPILIILLALVILSGFVSAIDFASTLGQKFTIPGDFQALTKIALGIEFNAQIDLQSFVFLSALWLIVLLIVHEFLALFTPFGNRWLSWGWAVFLTLGIAVFGVLYKLTSYLTAFNKSADITGFIAILALLMIIFSALFYPLRRTKRSLETKMSEKTESEPEIYRDIKLNRNNAKKKI